jgi:hypothetical protein
MFFFLKVASDLESENVSNYRRVIYEIETLLNEKDKSKIPEKIAILRLDTDWYESTKVPLENFYDQITAGGYIIIDDYLTCFGSRKAVDEYLSNNNIQTEINLDGRGGVWFMKPLIKK